jgi:hypothetical protein
MDFKTTKFDVEASGLNYHLGLRSSIDIDYWVDKTNQFIEWKGMVMSNPQGVTNIYGYSKSVFFWISFRVELNDLSPKEEEHLLKIWDCQIHDGYIDGTFLVNTDTDNEWQIEFSVEPKPSMIPQELMVNFMDKLMEIV